MKGKFGVVVLMFSSMTFAVPVSTPNDLSDTPIISGGGSGEKLSMNNCRAYQTDGAAIDLSGGEMLVFYGSGGEMDGEWLAFFGIRRDIGYIGYDRQVPASFGGYLATKTTYSGTAYVKVKGGRPAEYGNGYSYGTYYYGTAGYAIGLFARNSDQKADFIAGAGAGGSSIPYQGRPLIADRDLASGGGWAVSGQACGRIERVIYSYWRPPIYWGTPIFYTYEWECEPGEGGNINGEWWFSGYTIYYLPSGYTGIYYPTPGFHGGYYGSGGASSISAFYNSYTRDYTSPVNSLTIAKGGFWGLMPPALYVCQ